KEKTMNGPDLIRIVDLMHRDKNIPKEVIFEGIEAALQLATQKHYGTEEEIAISIDRDSGEIKAQKGDLVIDPGELGRIAAQSAKQVMIQKIREAECKAIFDEYAAMKGDLVHGTVQRFEGGAATVTLGTSEAILPRGAQIPGETHHVGERVKAGVRGSRIKNLGDELGGERIDVVRWNDSLQVMIPNALQPAQIEEVFLYPRLGRAIGLVKEDQLSLAIGRRGQNVRLASKLVGWD